jgi:TM2 domain-containing membrane protein YozV
MEDYPKWKSPILPAILGIIIVGFGHFYLRKWVTGILLIVVTGIFVLLTTVLVAPVFWIISGVWAYYDAKNYNREAGFTRKGTDSEEEEEVESDEEEEVDPSEVLLDELRALHSTLRNGVTVASILLLIILGLMLYLLLHFTRFVLAP